MISGGGTGGHIYPAIAIGKAITQLNSEFEIRYVGTKEGLEQKIMAREKLPLDLILSGKLNFSGNIMQKIKTLVKIPIGLMQSFFLILKHQPQFVLGVGGYASAPFVMMASLMGKKTALWEPNAHPGMANRLLSKSVNKAYLVFDDAKKYFSSKNVQVFGMPLRAEIDAAVSNAVPRAVETNKLSILCFGGSQGSVFLNEKISDFILAHPELKNEIHLIHQTGPLDFEKMKAKYGTTANVELHEFIYDMPHYYEKADIQFCRGGASTIAEAAAFGVVPIIVPLNAADNHQLKNAEVVVKQNAGYLFKQSDFNESNFSNIIMKLKADTDFRLKMSQNLRKLAPHQAAQAIAKDILNQII
ncbi:MAG: UDP-N-acetylglucosamine--N-acetylmuramyl-(pentapeptide) pyrophosphoryl-undecaprenol N-acetylglucosamine transferase [Bdellovibrio sp.]|nr:UDP-N-acetylglucosamine--N-acetylmuramyl-(pentapeptide) pyrophosphoryl-undecaprenol N-acetylglucosamine transferase [Bdellovibrio sp.]